MISASDILEVEDLELSFGGVHALAGVNFSVKHGEILSIIGPNGAGKTTLLNAISGVFRPTRGRICFDGEECTTNSSQSRARAGIARTFQNLALFKGMTVEQNLLIGRHVHMRSGVFSCGAYWGPAHREERNQIARVGEILDFLGLRDVKDVAADTLPYGLQKRVEIGRALAVEPKLLLLDEPMAGMNHGEKSELATLIVDLNQSQGITVILIEHDMGVVMNLSHRIVVLDYGKRIAEGTPAEIAGNQTVIAAYLGQD